MTNQEKCKDDFYSNADRRRLFFLIWHRFEVDGFVHLDNKLFMGSVTLKLTWFSCVIDKIVSSWLTQNTFDNSCSSVKKLNKFDILKYIFLVCPRKKQYLPFLFHQLLLWYKLVLFQVLFWFHFHLLFGLRLALQLHVSESEQLQSLLLS